MTPSERLKEIEAKLAKDPYYMEFEGNADFEWLIARVKKLTEALERLRDGHELQFKNYIPDKNPYYFCIHALEDES